MSEITHVVLPPPITLGGTRRSGISGQGAPIDHDHGDIPAHGVGYHTQQSEIISGHGSNVTDLAATTAYLGQGPTSAGALYATEANSALSVPYAGTASNFRFRINSAQGGGGTLVVTLRKNGADTAITVTFAAGAAASIQSDTTHTVTFAAGDTLDLAIANNDAGAVSATLGSWSLEYDRTA